MQIFLKNIFLSAGIINLSIPVLDFIPEQMQPNSDIIKYIILPILSAVIIPLFQRLIDKLLPVKKETKNPKNT